MSNFIKKKPEECSIGDTIKFRVISPFDENVYSGTIQAICDYDRARPYGDLAATHAAMVQGATTMGKELDDCRLDTFFVIKLVYNQGNKLSGDNLMAVGFQWIMDGLVELVSESRTYDVRLFNVSPEQAAQAVAILRNSDFVCKLVPR
jgi:hypothetical protein